MSSLTQPPPIPDAASVTEQRPSPFAPRTSRFRLQCHYCGYGLTTSTTSVDRCPKCGGSAWERCDQTSAEGTVEGPSESFLG
jgi:predicted RNA-binding Zn-ribbon protein involved in translation (DUF1610 family)